MLANRGCLHDGDGHFTGAAFVSTRWLACTLDGPPRPINPFMGYSQLFGLDEATLLAAGHRPCAHCRPDAYATWKGCWRRAHGIPADHRLLVAELDTALHRARLDRHGRQRTHRARLGDIPDGVFVMMPEDRQGGSWTAALIWKGETHPWSHEGYGAPAPIRPSVLVDVLTPAPTVEVLRAGYVPTVAVAHAQPTWESQELGL